MDTIDLREHYLHLTPDERAPAIPVDGFWDQLMSGTFTDPRVEGVAQGGWLVSRFTHAGDWEHWECHPEGDEVLICVSGTAVFDIEAEDGTVRSLPLTAHRVLVIPAGAWHRGRGAGPAEIVALTAGKGTQHRPV